MRKPEDYRIVIELDLDKIIDEGFSSDKMANRLNRWAESETKLKRIGLTEWQGTEANNNFQDYMHFCGRIGERENWILPYTISWKAYFPDLLGEDRIVYDDWLIGTEDAIKEGKIGKVSLGA